MTLPVRPDGRTLVMGIVNVTPDSFSDGGRYVEARAGIEHGLALLADGADLLDVGGESTRPGADRVSEEDELARVLPVVTELARSGGVVSVDTMRASVAAACLEVGAAIINDVSGGMADEQMAGVVAQAGVPFVAQHWRGHSATMNAAAVYDDVVAEVRAELAARADALLEAGIARENLVLDPGFGFAKRAEHDWALLAHLDRLTALGQPILVGTSRKRFLGLAGGTAEAPRPAAGRDVATAATSLLAAQGGAWAVRVHDAAASVAALETWRLTEEHR